MAGRGNSAHPGSNAEQGERQRHPPWERDGPGKEWVRHWKPMEGPEELGLLLLLTPERENGRQSQKLLPAELLGTLEFSYPSLERVIWGLGTSAHLVSPETKPPREYDVTTEVHDIGKIIDMIYHNVKVSEDSVGKLQSNRL